MLSVALHQQAVKANNVSLPRPVCEIMNRWVLQMGFPVVTIDTPTGKVTQRHFLLDPDSNVTVESPYKYATQKVLTFSSSLLPSYRHHFFPARGEISLT